MGQAEPRGWFTPLHPEPLVVRAVVTPVVSSDAVLVQALALSRPGSLLTTGLLTGDYR